MEFNATVAGAAFVILFGVLAVGTLMSPMQTSTVGMVMGGLLVFGLVTLGIGVKHGEYRVRSSR